MQWGAVVLLALLVATLACGCEATDGSARGEGSAPTVQTTSPSSVQSPTSTSTSASSSTTSQAVRVGWCVEQEHSVATRIGPEPRFVPPGIIPTAGEVDEAVTLTWEWTEESTGPGFRQVVLVVSAPDGQLPAQRPTPWWAQELGFPEFTHVLNAAGTEVAVRVDAEYRAERYPAGVSEEQSESWYQLDWQSPDGSNVRVMSRGVDLDHLLAMTVQPWLEIEVRKVASGSVADAEIALLDSLLGARLGDALVDLASVGYCMEGVAVDGQETTTPGDVLVVGVTVVGQGRVFLDAHGSTGDTKPVTSEAMACEPNGAPRPDSSVVLLDRAGGYVLVDLASGEIGRLDSPADVVAISPSGWVVSELKDGRESFVDSNGLRVFAPELDEGEFIGLVNRLVDQIVAVSLQAGDLERELVVRITAIGPDGSTVWTESRRGVDEALFPLTSVTANGSILVAFTFAEGSAAPQRLVLLDEDGSTSWESMQSEYRSAYLDEDGTIWTVGWDNWLDNGMGTRFPDVTDILGATNGRLLVRTANAEVASLSTDDGSQRTLDLSDGCRLSVPRSVFHDDRVSVGA